jgi:hypothetical protein
MSQTWEFTFMVVMDGENKDEALEHALDYLMNQHVEPTNSRLLEETEDEE